MALRSKNVFQGIIGHERQLKFLSNLLERKTFSHAYLFVGLPGLGKDEIAKRFISAILGLEKGASLRKHPDIQFLKGEGMIRIEQIRALKHHLHLQPYSSSYKITFLSRAEKMTPEAANSFLKILEEPRGQSILILTASRCENLLPTITSRCQILKFYRVDQNQIKSFLLKTGLGEKKADFIAHLSQGCPGRAIEYLERPDKLEQEVNLVKDLIRLRQDSLASRMNYAQENAQSDEKVRDILSVWLKVYHDLLLIKQKCPDLVSNYNLKKDFEELDHHYSLFEIRLLVDLIRKSIQNLRYNTNRRLALEVLLLHI